MLPQAAQHMWLLFSFTKVWKRKKVNITDVRIKSSTKRNNAWNYFGLYMFCCRFNYILNCRGFTSIFVQSVMNPFMVLALIKAFIICHDFCTQCVSELVLDAIITSLDNGPYHVCFFLWRIELADVDRTACLSAILSFV